MTARAAKVQATKLYPNEMLALVTHNGAKRKYYTAKRIGELSGLSTDKALKALMQLVKLEYAVKSDYAGENGARFALTEAGVDVAVAA